MLSPEDKVAENRFAVSGKRFGHIVNILRSKVGDSLEVGLIDGPTGNGVIRSIEKDSVILECTWSQDNISQKPALELIVALPRPQTLKKVLQISATMEVERLHLVNANRVEQCYFNASVMEPESISYHLLKGLSQGKTTTLPKVSTHPRFRCFFEEILPRLEKDTQSDKIVKLLADVQADEYLTPAGIKGADRIFLAIGPEGGWVPFELEVMQTQGFKVFKLGRWPLRVEHALVASLSQLHLACHAIE